MFQGKKPSSNQQNTFEAKNSTLNFLHKKALGSKKDIKSPNGSGISETDGFMLCLFHGALFITYMVRLFPCGFANSSTKHKNWERNIATEI